MNIQNHVPYPIRFTDHGSLNRSLDNVLDSWSSANQSEEKTDHPKLWRQLTIKNSDLSFVIEDKLRKDKVQEYVSNSSIEEDIVFVETILIQVYPNHYHLIFFVILPGCQVTKELKYI